MRTASLSEPAPVYIDLYGAQFDFVTTTARRPAFVGGINSGKTWAGCIKALSIAKDIPKSFGMITGPSLDILRDATVRSFLEFAGKSVANHNKNEKHITLVNGSELVYRTTADPEALRGPNLDWVWMDEAALSTEESFKICTGRVRAGGRAGPVFITCTPKGRNYIWRRWVESPTEQFEIYRATSYDNPGASQEWLADQEHELTGDFRRQELMGEFVAFEGLVYDEFSRETHVWTGKLPEYKRAIAGVDWGYTNPATIIVFIQDSDNRMYAVDEFYQRGIRLEEHTAAAVEMARKWRIEEFICDPSEPEHIRAFREAGLRARGADNAIIPGVQAVKARLAVRGDGRPRWYATPNTPNLTAEMESYQWAEHKGERIDKPLKEGDHAVDAARYVALAIDRRRETTQQNYMR